MCRLSAAICQGIIAGYGPKLEIRAPFAIAYILVVGPIGLSRQARVSKFVLAGTDCIQVAPGRYPAQILGGGSFDLKCGPMMTGQVNWGLAPKNFEINIVLAA